MPTSPRLSISRLTLFSLASALPCLVFASFFALRASGEGCGLPGAVFLIASALGQALLYTAPPLLATMTAALWKRRRPALLHAFAAAAVAWLCTCLLCLDCAILNQFGFHINGLVINLLLTPGGFDSMGLDAATLVPAIAGTALLLIVFEVLMAFCIFAQPALALAQKLRVKHTAFAALAAAAVALLLSMLLSGLADFFSIRGILACGDAFPLNTAIRMRTILKGLGFKQPPREKLLSLDQNNAANKLKYYPAKPIVRNNTKKPNVVWLVAESLRGDFLTDEIMPNTMVFSTRACRFTNHYSGGHATRFAMFSMFYGLYGLNWDPFLKNRRAPLLMDWLKEDGYQAYALTSATFTYPEFDKTIFAHLKPHQLDTMPSKLNAWERDSLLADRMIAFIKNRDRNKPFFTFAFFESTHAPYSFPEDAVIRSDYMKSINYATVSQKDAALLYNRDVNAAHFLDSQIARITQALADEPALLENTLVIVTGDHGEEFYENGRLGHTSSFVKPQLHVPLVIKLPDTAPRVFDSLTNHTDIIPTIAPFLGVKNPPEDFCVGQNMLATDYRCDWFIACGWQLAVLIDKDYKYLLPISLRCAMRKNALTRFNDTPCTGEELDSYRKSHADILFKAQKALTQFVK